MKSQYPYTLAGWNEGRDKTLVCPGCGLRHCYKEYVWNDTHLPIDPSTHLVGRCDHEWCGYHVKPKEWFSKNPEQRRNDYIPVPEKQRKRIEIDRQTVARSMTCYDINTFVKWLVSLPWDKEQREAIPALLINYCVGTTKNGYTIWWQVDEKGVIRTGKIMKYKADGHRDKEHPYFNWTHCLMQKSGQFCPTEDYQMVQCLFGLHLIKLYEQRANELPIWKRAEEYKKTTIHIVESEKAALLMSIFDHKAMNGNIWMATGGIENLKDVNLLPLRNYKVICYPDVNGVEKWRDRIKGIPNVELATEWIKSITDKDPPGAGIDDLCLRRLMEGKEALLQEFRENNKGIDILVRKLLLEPYEK